MTYFHEDQQFRKSWLWLAIAIPILFAVWLLVVTPGAPASAAITVVLAGIGVTLLFWFARLETTVTGDRVVVRFHGLWPTRSIKLDDIAEYAPTHYTMWDSGGWGVHLGLAGMTYNVSGNEGVRFRLKNRRQVLVGTQRPVEFAAGIANAMAARGSS